MPDADALALSVEELARRCAAETERFFQRTGAPDNQFCFELFRRALAERNDAAWNSLYPQYRTLIAAWIHEHPRFGAVEEDVDYFINSAFTNMWRSCTPERFTNFSDLPALLAYLKSCVHTAILNHLRKRRPAQTGIAEELLGNSAGDPMSNAILDKLARAELWQLVSDLFHNEKEQLVTELFFIQGHKPSAIYEQHAELFTSVQEVYRVKQNLLERLSRNEELRQFHQSLRENR